MVCTGVIARSVGARGSRLAAVVLFAVLGFPFAITVIVPYSLIVGLTVDLGGGQGLVIGRTRAKNSHFRERCSIASCSTLVRIDYCNMEDYLEGFKNRLSKEPPRMKA